MPPFRKQRQGIVVRRIALADKNGAPGLRPQFLRMRAAILRHLRGEELITHLGLEYYD